MKPELVVFSLPHGRTFAVEPFGAFLALGLVLGMVCCWRLLRQTGRDTLPARHALIAALIGALVGARLLYVLGSPQRESALEVLAFGQGGLSGFGAVWGAVALGAFSLRRARQPILPWFDLAAPGVLLCAFVARLGCYLAGCDFGRPLFASAPGFLRRLGSFPAHPSPAFFEASLLGALAPGGAATLPLHPTELYEAAGLLAVAAYLLAWRARQRWHGELFWRAALAYSLLRFVLEFARGDADRGVWRVLSLNAWCALLSIALVFAFAVRARVRGP